MNFDRFKKIALECLEEYYREILSSQLSFQDPITKGKKPLKYYVPNFILFLKTPKTFIFELSGFSDKKYFDPQVKVECLDAEHKYFNQLNNKLQNGSMFLVKNSENVGFVNLWFSGSNSDNSLLKEKFPFLDLETPRAQLVSNGNEEGETFQMGENFSIYLRDITIINRYNNNFRLKNIFFSFIITKNKTLNKAKELIKKPLSLHR